MNKRPFNKEQLMADRQLPLASWAFIDLVVVDMPCTERLPTNLNLLVTHTGQYLNERQFFSLENREGNSVARLTKINKKTLRISVCPPTFVTGSNLIGVGDIRATLKATLNLIWALMEERHKIKLSAPKKLTDIVLVGVHCTTNWNLGSAEAVRNAILEAGHRLTEDGFRTTTWGAGETVQATRNSRIDLITIYDKRLELQSHGPRRKSEMDNLAIQTATGWLRIEYYLSARRLRELGLTTINRWNRDTAKMLFKRCWKQLRCLRGMTIVVGPEPIKGIPPALHRALLIEQFGAGKLFEKSTRRKNRHALAAKGLRLRKKRPTEPKLAGPVLSPAMLVRETNAKLVEHVRKRFGLG